MNTHETINAKEFFLYLSNNFIQVVNEICDNINKKCDKYTKVLKKESLHDQKITLFNTKSTIKELKELNKCIYDDCIIPCYNATMSIFRDYFIAENVSISGMHNILTRSNKWIRRLFERSITSLAQTVNNSIVPTKYSFALMNSKLYYDVVSKYYSVAEVLFNSSLNFFQQFNRLNTPYNTKKDLSQLTFSVRQQVFSQIETLFDTVQQRNLSEILSKLPKFITDFKNNIIEELKHIHNCQNGSMVCSKSEKNYVMDATRLFSLEYDIEPEIFNKDKYLFHSGMERIIKNMQNVYLNLPVTKKEYLNDINDILSKYRD